MAKYELNDKKVALVTSNEGVGKAVTLSGKDVSSAVKPSVLSSAVEKGEQYVFLDTESGNWKRDGYLTASGKEEMDKYVKNYAKEAKKAEAEAKAVEPEVLAFKEFVHNSVEIRPELLKMPDLKWKYLVRSVLKGKNIMMTGPAGSGKTFAVQQLTKALNGKAKTVKKTVSREELEAMKQNMKIDIATYKKVS